MYGTVRTVVWEDGGGNSPSYPIAPGRARSLGGASPLRTLMVGTVSRTARVSGVTRNLKEAAGKALA